MMPPPRNALSILALAALGACTSFTGKDQDGGAADMATLDAAVVDAGDAAIADAGVSPKVFPPIEGCSGAFPFTVATANGLVVLHHAEEATELMDRNEPFCACVPATTNEPVRWATCKAGESNIGTCRTDDACPATNSESRAFACNFDRLVEGVGGEVRPSCSSMQYSYEVCADCVPPNDRCVVYADGSHECLAQVGGLPTRRNENVCRLSPAATRFAPGMIDADGGITQDSSVCALGADCYFTAAGTATCAVPVPRHERYPTRGCSEVGTAEKCVVEPGTSSNLTPYSTTPPPALLMRTCEVTRVNGDPWTDALWTSMASDDACSTTSLCDVEGTESVCIEPSWSVGTGTAENQVCGDCYDLPCFVYEDGSYECSHHPTRTYDATGATPLVDGGIPPDAGTEFFIGCCKREPGMVGGFLPGECLYGVFDGSDGECATCSFTVKGEATRCDDP